MEMGKESINRKLGGYKKGHALYVISPLSSRQGVDYLL